MLAYAMSDAEITPSTDVDSVQNAGAQATDDKSAKLITILKTFGLWKRIQLLQKPAVIVADAEILADIPSKATPQGARRISVWEIEQGRFPTPLNGPYFVVTTKDELAVKQRLRELLRAWVA